jgi:hypothetical protein
LLEAAPRKVGVKVTLIVQLAPTASEVPQLFVWAKGVYAVIELIESADVPLFESVRDCVTLVVPTNCGAKVNDAGEREATGGGGLPIPLKETDPPIPVGEPLAVSVALREPAVVGLKMRLIVQLAPGAIDAGQLFICVKSGVLIVICDSV